MKVNDKFRASCGAICTIFDTVPVPKNVKFSTPYLSLFVGALHKGNDEWVMYYDPTGRCYHPEDFEPMSQDDPFSLIGRYTEPQTRYFLRAKDGSYFGPNSSPVSYTDLNAAQLKCQELDWLFRPIAFLEQEGVR